MKTANITINGIGMLSQSRYHNTPKLEKEQADAYEERTWRNKMHIDKSGRVVIPAMALKFALVDAAKFMSEKIKGRGQSTYTKRFSSGIMVAGDLVTDKTAADIEGVWIHANADGVRGSGKRVPRCMPSIDSWSATGTVHILDDLITEDVFERYLSECGKFIGIGQFRAGQGGNNGRFEVAAIAWD